MYFVLLFSLLLIGTDANPYAFDTNVVFLDSNKTQHFGIRHDELHRWKHLCEDFEHKHAAPGVICSSVKRDLEMYQYPAHIIDGLESTGVGAISSVDASAAILSASAGEEATVMKHLLDDTEGKRLVFGGELSAHVPSNPHIDVNLLTTSHDSTGNGRTHLFDRMSAIPAFIRRKQRIIIYQSKGFFTGGTVALELLHRQFLARGFDSLLCDLSNEDDSRCVQPADEDVVITGEWCKGVLASHGSGASAFKGRGVQYHLGFHHSDDICRGHLTVTDSHFLKASLGRRILGGYYLGCEMVPLIRQTLATLFTLHKRPVDENNRAILSIKKEDLVVLDTDLADDYSPETRLHVRLPQGFRIVEARGVPREKMPLLLLRAKVVVDLAMPGPERLVGEGCLLGAIPIISSRWNGASSLDFPGIRRVDHLNGSDISQAIVDVAQNFEAELKNPNVAKFQAYIMSMWRRIHHTADIFAGSSMLHFIIVANSLQEEVMATFQILGLLFLHPMASIDLYVSDRGWFCRHHYAFMSMLREAGYIRFDMLDPHDKEVPASHSYIRIRPMAMLMGIITSEQLPTASMRQSGLLPSWGEGLLCVLVPGVLPVDAFVIMDATQHVAENATLPQSILLVNASGAIIDGIDLCTRKVDAAGSVNEACAQPELGIISPTANLTYGVGVVRAFLEMNEDSTLKKNGDRRSFRHVCDIILSMLTSDNNTQQLLHAPAFVDSISQSAAWGDHFRFSRQTTSSITAVCNLQ